MKKKIRINPILKKEMMVGSRSIKMSLGIMGVNILLTLIVLLVLAINNSVSDYSGYDYSNLVYLFPILGCVECGLLSLIVPIITSGAISGERERQTLDIMLTTPVSPIFIAIGKLESAMMVVMMYMVTSIPVMAIAFVLGGMSWWALLGLVVMLLYLGIYVGSVGIFCSSVVKKSVMATLLTFVIGIGILILTSTVFSVGTSIISYRAYYAGADTNLGLLPVVLMFNPYTPVFDFMIQVMSSSSIGEMIEDTTTVSLTLQNLYHYWIPVSMVLNLFVAYGFLKLAAKNITITKKRKKKK